MPDPQKQIFFFLFVVSLLGFAESMRGQEYPDYLQFRRYSLEHGLSQSTVNVILQDRLGFLWLGTQDGLNRFDGYNFYVYKYHPSDSLTLPNNFIYDLAEDERRGCLWISTHGGGLAKLDYSTGRIERYQQRAGEANALADNYLYSILCDRQGRVWICTRDHGLDVYDPGKQRFSHYRAQAGSSGTLNHNRVQSVFEDKKGNIWIGTGMGLMRYDSTHDTFVSVHLTGSTVLSIFEDHAGRLWFGTDGQGLFCMYPETGVTRQYLNDPRNPRSLSNNYVRVLYEDTDRQLWIGTGYGLNRLDLQGKLDPEKPVFSLYQADPTDPNSLSNNLIQSLWEDPYRNLWVGTNGGGLNQLSKLTLSFRLYTNRSLRLKEGNLDDVLAIALDANGWLWVGTFGEGMIVFDRNGKRYRTFRHEHGKKQSLPENSVFAFLPDTGQTMWVGTYGGLTRVSYGEKLFQGEIRFEHYSADPRRPRSLSHNRIRCLIRAKDGKIWIGTYGGGLNIFDPLTKQFTLIQHDAHRSNRISNNRISNNNVWVLHQDESGDIWVGTYGGGLNRYSPATGTWKNYIHQSYDSCSLSNDVVLAIYSDTARIWVGTRVGLNVMDRRTERFRYYTVAHGLPNDVIYGILPDDHGRLWLSTNNGLSRVQWINDTTPEFTSFDRHSGLQGNEFNIGAYTISRDGEMFFGGINGFNSFYPDSIRLPTNPPPVLITAFKKFDRIFYTAPSIHDSLFIELNYRENFFSFEFAALDFTDPAKNQYAYRLEGFDENWVQCGQRRYATYTNLDGGTYTFLVKGAGHNGIWSQQPAKVTLTIIPPVWKTAWFRISALLLLMGSVLGFMHWRILSIKKQRRVLEEQVRERTLEIQDKNKRLLEALEEIHRQKDSLDTVNRQLTETLEELKQYQNQLIQSEKIAALGHLIAGIAHEINNPLSFIDGNLSYIGEYLHNALNMIREMERKIQFCSDADKVLAILEEVKKGYDFSFMIQDAEKTIEACRHGTQRIKRIVQDLRHLSLTDEPDRRQMNVNECLDQAIQSLKHFFPAKIRIIREYGTLPVIQGYPVLLTQAFRNIVLNALQAIDETGEIFVQTNFSHEEPVTESGETISGRIQVQIKDNGTGVAPEHLSRIFDPFFTTKSPGQGTGLGLTMAYEMIRRHEGNIEIRSFLQKGTEVYIFLPVKTNSAD